MSASEIDKLREHFAIEHKADWPSRYSGFSIACLVNEMPSSRARMQEYIEAEDHDRIMAERDELWKRATKFVMPGEMDTGESIEHYIKTLEQTIAELRAEVERLKRANQVVPKDAELLALNGKFRDTIASQKRVIEKLKGMVSHYETCATVDRYDDEKVPCDCGLEKELAAIEKEGEYEPR